MKKHLFISLLIIGMIGFGRTFSQNEPIHPNIIKTPIAFEITKPLKDNPIVEDQPLSDEEFYMNAQRDREINPNIFPPDFKNMPADPGIQTKPGWLEGSKATLQNFVGQNSSSYPPDCSGDANATYFFQVVNTTYAIYNKTTGIIVAGPSALNSIFNSSLPGASCNSGDPIVLWDEQAGRWFYAEFSLCTSNDYMLIAVSQTSDPTGSWYSWSYDVADMPDYMKFGIWQDGYYMATNTSPGNDVYVFNRAAMIAGNPSPTMIGFDNPWRPVTFDGFHCILPLDNDGPWAPSGTPGQFITIVDDGQSNPADQLWIYQLSANWTTPSSSTFNRTQTLNVNSFSGNFNNSWNNVPQPGTTQKLDAISTVLMFRAQYRNFSGTQRIVCAHAIAQTSTQATMRWYELENTGSGWSIRQQNTYNPDSYSRWNMGIAMNGLREIGIGYSISHSATVYPGIRYIGQSASANAAASNTLDMAETTIWTGSYSQTGINRWGDYSQISVDPSDDHTFWYTNEYMASGTHGTRIASFQFTPPSLTANFSGTPTSVCTGGSVTFTDASVGGATSWSWSFPGGTPSTFNGQTPPAIYYNTAGTYDVSLTVSNGSTNNTMTKTGYITVSGIIADFSGSPATLNIGGTVTFTNLSSCSPTSWSWSFPGGTPSAASGVGPHTITYNTIGTYNVSLTVTNANGSDTETKTGYINVINCTYCTSSASTFDEEWISNVTFNTINNTTTGTAGYNNYTAISTNVTKGTAYTASVSCGSTGTWIENIWIFIDWNQDCDFSDAGESSDLGQTTGPGTRTLSITIPTGATSGATRMRVSLKYNADPTSCEAFNYGEVEDYTLVVAGSVVAPVANFSASTTTPIVGATVTFTDQSTNTPTSWAWSFSPATVTYMGGTTSASQNPQVQFNAGGYYTVILTATNAGGSDGETKTNYILATAPPVANFSASTTTPYIGQPVSFTDLSTNTPTSWAWSFSPTSVTYVGGTTAASQNPQVMFNAGGLYSVTLTATNAAGSNPETKNNYISVLYAPVANFTASTTAPYIGQIVTFTDQSANSPSSWVWSFSPATATYAGGTTSASQNPQVQFNAGGLYSVTLIATNASGSDGETKTNFISVLHVPVADFFADNISPLSGETVTFTDISVPLPDSWSWNFIPATVTFMGGTNSSSQNPQVQFDVAGYYTIELTAVNASGSDTETKTDYIFVQNAVINLDITVFLEGPFNGTGMTPYMNGILPLSQPYNVFPWNYPGAESVAAIPNPNVVDWLLVELRDAADATSATSATLMDRQAAFLLSNGKIVGMDGASNLQFSNTLTQQLYVVIWHRNHLGVMSSGFVSESGGTYSYNFSTDASQAYGSTDAHKQIGPGVWGMIGGDGNRDGNITDTDKSPIWESQSGNQGYMESDYNLDTQSDNKDKDDVWAPNLGKGNQVPN